MNREVYGVIYKVKNKINNKVYIGQTTVSFRNRYKIGKNVPLNEGYYNYQKIYFEKNDRHCNKHILSSMEKYGYENFIINEQIDVVYKHKYSQEELDTREKYWIYYYQSNDKRYGYNKTEGGSGSGRLKPSCIKVVLLNNEKIFPSLALASEYVGLKSYDSISECCKNNQKYAGKFNEEFAVWCFYDDYIKLTKEEIKERVKKSNNTRKNKKSNRLILCINNNKVYNSVRKCSKDLGINHGRVSECCKGDREFVLIDDIEYRFRYMFNPPSLICITTKEMFNMTKDASEKYQCDASGITKCCKRKISYCGKLGDGTKLIWRRLNWTHNKQYKRIN